LLAGTAAAGAAPDFASSSPTRRNCSAISCGGESGRIFSSAGQHEAITAALRAGNLAAAVETLERHWRGGLDFVVPWLHERRR